MFPISGAFLLAGPTAVGKSEVALLLAERTGGEIVSVDSMQVYRGLDIGTAKPGAAERGRVPHHLIDVADLTHGFSAAEFVQLARQATGEIQERGHLPILCGGTGLYFKALLNGLGTTPPSEPALRAELQKMPLSELLAELERRDPAAWEQIDRKNPRRVVRAVEVIRLTGKPISTQRTDWKNATRSPDAPRIFGLSRSPEDLRQRIDARVDKMFERGLVAETKRLLDHSLAENKTAMQALGYRQVVEHLRGERSLAETIELVKVRTRQFAKRQMTWFRNQLDVRWVQLDAKDSPSKAAEKLRQVAPQPLPWSPMLP